MQQSDSHFVSTRERTMDSSPTLLILAPPSQQRGQGEPVSDDACPPPCYSAVDRYDGVESTIHTGLTSDVSVLLIGAQDVGTRARRILPGKNIIDMPAHDLAAGLSGLDVIARLLATGVSASPHASGWMAVPASVGISLDTIQKMAALLPNHPIVSCQYRQFDGFPLAFSSEFYSELIKIQTGWDLRKLTNRYPIHHIAISSPISLVPASHSTLSFEPPHGVLSGEERKGC
jgi:CTP:molybdopterin cytidylyltransferase MocA